MRGKKRQQENIGKNFSSPTQWMNHMEKCMSTEPDTLRHIFRLYPRLLSLPMRLFIAQSEKSIDFQFQLQALHRTEFWHFNRIEIN